MDLKIGDTIKILDNLEVNEIFEDIKIDEERTIYKGKEAKITKVYSNGGILLDIDKGEFIWVSSMFYMYKDSYNQKDTLISIDGLYGRIEYYLCGEQKDEPITYNNQIIDRDSDEELERQEFIKGLPNKISKNDYFRMALLNSLKEISNNLIQINNSLDEKEIQ